MFRIIRNLFVMVNYKLDKVIAGEALDEVVEALVAEDQTQRLAEGSE